jgi:hypothetical protein
MADTIKVNRTVTMVAAKALLFTKTSSEAIRGCQKITVFIVIL